MADKKISELDAITGAATAADDYFIVVDSSGAATKKISRAELNNAIEQDVLSVVDINGGTIDGTVIGGASAAAGTFTTFTSTGIDDNAASTTITINSYDNVGIGNGVDIQSHFAIGTGAEQFEVNVGSGFARIQIYDRTAGAYDNFQVDALTHVFRTGQTERVRIDSSGNFGIGTSTLNGTMLVVAQNATDAPSSSGNMTTGSFLGAVSVGGSALNIGHDADGTWYNSAYFNNAGVARIHRWLTGGTERMRIDTSGNVGIGTAPDSGTPLHVQESSASLPANPTASALLVERAGTVAMTLGTANTGTASIFLGDPDNLTTGRLQYDNNDNSLQFWANSNERMRVSNSGYVGIGTTPSYRLHISNGSSTGTAMQLQTTGSGHNFDMVDGTGTARFRNVNGETRLYGDLSTGGNGNIIFFPQGTTERMRIDSSGNVGIGTSPDTKLHVVDTVTGGQFIVASTGTNAVNKVGTFATKHYTNAEEPVLGLAIQSTSTENQVFIGGVFSQFNAATEIRFYTAPNNTTTGGTERMRIQSNGVVRPSTDNLQPIGAAAYRWSVVYAGTGTINTSDAREKQQIADLDDAERRVAVALKGLVKKYKYNDAVELKGDDARIHVGVIAQEVVAAFEAEGLDATRYALLCYDVWDAEPEETDDEGNVINPARDAGERYGIRYDELLAFMIAAM